MVVPLSQILAFVGLRSMEPCPSTNNGSGGHRAYFSSGGCLRALGLQLEGQLPDTLAVAIDTPCQTLGTLDLSAASASSLA
jgi:hypothetical protein